MMMSTKPLAPPPKKKTKAEQKSLTLYTWLTKKNGCWTDTIPKGRGTRYSGRPFNVVVRQWIQVSFHFQVGKKFVQQVLLTLEGMSNTAGNIVTCYMLS